MSQPRRAGNVPAAPVPKRKRPASGTAEQRAFPPEAYDYDGDIRPEDVKRLRERAAPHVDDGEWDVVDGYVGPR